MITMTTQKNEEIPRSEYPRPEARREHWTCLNGIWGFEFDPERIGKRNKWFKPEKSNFSQEIMVPFVFQSELSGINSQDFVDTVWYAREFVIPKQYKEKNVLLHFGAVDYECEVYVNGALVGTHKGGLTPFKFNITAFLTENPEEEQNLVVKVWDPPFDPSIPRGKQTTKTFLDGCSYEKSLGIWQTVWLEYVEDAYLSRSDYYIRYNMKEGQIKTSITVEGKIKHSHILEAQLYDGEKPLSNVGFLMSKPSMGIPGLESDMLLDFEPATIERWDLDNTKLYQVRFRLIDGDSEEEEPIDELTCTLGFREISYKDNKFHLNGKPLYLKMTLYQGYWTKGLWTAPNDELFKRDLELNKKMGYNGMRFHQIVADPRMIYWADKLGVILWGEIANAFGSDARAKDNLLKEWSEIVRRDRCHPSITMWTPINESWGTGNLSKEDNQHWLRSIYYWTKSMDPTRPVNTNDGWENPDTADIISIHHYCFAEDISEQYPVKQPEDFTKFFDGFKPSRYTIIPGLKTTKKPVMITEWGGWGMYYDNPNRAPNPREAWGYQGILYKSFNDVLELYNDFIEQLEKRKDWICGHCYTEFNDQYQEVNGMLTFDRRPKGDLNKLKAINDKLHY